MPDIPAIETSHETIVHDCVKMYLPKKLEHLSKLYRFLQDTLADPVGRIALKGFSIYEVDGAFQGRIQPYEERTLVIRLMLPRQGNEQPSVESRVKEFGLELANLAATEEQIWICHFPQTVAIFRPASA